MKRGGRVRRKSDKILFNKREGGDVGGREGEGVNLQLVDGVPQALKRLQHVLPRFGNHSTPLPEMTRNAIEFAEATVNKFPSHCNVPRVV